MTNLAHRPRNCLRTLTALFGALAVLPLAAPAAQAATYSIADPQIRDLANRPGMPCDVAAAIENANQDKKVYSQCPAGSPGQDEIQVNFDLTRTTSSPLIVRSDIWIHAASHKQIDANKKAASLFRIEGGGVLRFENMTVRNARTGTAGSGSVFLAMEASRLFILTSKFFDNAAYTDGGVVDSDGVMKVFNSTFKNNWTDQGAGGAIHYSGPDGVVSASMFSANRAGAAPPTNAANGGSIACTGSSARLDLYDSDIEDSQSDRNGGGLYSDCALRVRTTRIEGNSTIDGCGGGLAIGPATPDAFIIPQSDQLYRGAVIETSRLASNVAQSDSNENEPADAADGGRGGGACVRGSASLLRSTVSDNVAAAGAQIAVNNSSSQRLDIVNTTLHANGLSLPQASQMQEQLHNGTALYAAGYSQVRAIHATFLGSGGGTTWLGKPAAVLYANPTSSALMLEARNTIISGVGGADNSPPAQPCAQFTLYIKTPTIVAGTSMEKGNGAWAGTNSCPGASAMPSTTAILPAAPTTWIQDSLWWNMRVTSPAGLLALEQDAWVPVAGSPVDGFADPTWTVTQLVAGQDQRGAQRTIPADVGAYERK